MAKVDHENDGRVAQGGGDGGNRTAAAAQRLPRGSTRPPNWFMRLCFGGEIAEHLVQSNLADQFRRALLTDFRALARPPEDAPEHRSLYDEALLLLSEPAAAWSEIYQAQKIKAHLQPDSQLDGALEQALIEAREIGIDVKPIDDRLSALGEDAPDAVEKRVHLLGLIADLQWERKKRFVCRELRAEYVRKVCRMTIGVGLCFFAALVWTVYANDPGNDGVRAFMNEHLRYPGLMISIASGLLGAWFSMLVSFGNRLSGLTLDELRVAQTGSSIFGRLIFGAASAVIFYFLLQSGLFSATILPEIDKLGFQPIAISDEQAAAIKDVFFTNSGGTLAGTTAGKEGLESISSATGSFLPTADLCLLIVWCVLCGFSEKMIPAALNRNADVASKTVGSDKTASQ